MGEAGHVERLGVYMCVFCMYMYVCFMYVCVVCMLSVCCICVYVLCVSVGYIIFFVTFCQHDMAWNHRQSLNDDWLHHASLWLELCEFSCINWRVKTQKSKWHLLVAAHK